MIEEPALFGFEHSYAASLELIPMVVRFRLDLCGIKLPLRHWQRFSRAERARLVQSKADSADSLDAWGQYLCGLIEAHSGESPERLAIDPAPAWNDLARVPERLVQCAAQARLAPPTLARWIRLSPVQRFCLVKLTRAGHDSESFLPAMREFGFATAQ